MRGNTAYIRIWKRAGTAQQAANTAPAANASADSQQELRDQLEAAIENRDSVANNYDPVKGTYGFNPYGDVDNPIEVAEANIQTLEAQIDLGRQQALASQTPTSSTAQTTQSNVATPPSRGASAAKGAALGTVKSANPNGFWGSLGRVGSALIGLPTGPTAYSGGAMGAGTTAPATGEMMWQFLFNPSELELEVGPEFKNAETWGVSDKGNSGQPLHWSHNKNAQLKFNSVLLNGFVFGRKVEVLEQGLIELFMARDGEGQHGPHVLEFVWGKRVFGPCVIKNVNIKEKMWDEGEVVNAELSFTLEQVPEWTINDGFVDVARPGRLATEGNPAVSGSSANNPSGTAAPSTESPNPGPAQSPAQKPSSSVNIAGQCKSIVSDREYLQRIINEVQSKLEGVGGLEYGPLGILKSDTRSVFKQNLEQYKRTFQKYSGNSFYKPSMREGVLGAKCTKTSSIEYSWNNSGNASVRTKDRNANSALLTCYKNILSVVNKEFNSNKCGSFATPSGGRQGPGLF